MKTTILMIIGLLACSSVDASAKNDDKEAIAKAAAFLATHCHPFPVKSEARLIRRISKAMVEFIEEQEQEEPETVYVPVYSPPIVLPPFQPFDSSAFIQSQILQQLQYDAMAAEARRNKGQE